MVKSERSPSLAPSDSISETPSPSPTTKKRKAQATTPTKPTPKKAKSSPSSAKKSIKSETTETGGTGGKKMGAWSGEELKMLYGIMCPKKVGVSWSDVAAQLPGRDAKSCNNKWSRMQGKILQALEVMGDA